MPLDQKTASDSAVNPRRLKFKTSKGASRGPHCSRERVELFTGWPLEQLWELCRCGLFPYPNDARGRNWRVGDLTFWMSSNSAEQAEVARRLSERFPKELSSALKVAESELQEWEQQWLTAVAKTRETINQIVRGVQLTPSTDNDTEDEQDEQDEQDSHDDMMRLFEHKKIASLSPYRIARLGVLQTADVLDGLAAENAGAVGSEADRALTEHQIKLRNFADATKAVCAELARLDALADVAELVLLERPALQIRRGNSSNPLTREKALH